MSRGLSASNLAAIAAKTVRPAMFVYMDFLGGVVRVWSGTGDFSWGGNTYTGVGIFGGITEIEETGTPVANNVTLSLSGIPSTMVAIAMDRRQYRGRKVRIWEGFFDIATETPTLLDTPIPVFAGRMDVMTPVDSGDTSTISLTCENRLVDLSRPRVRRYTDQDHRSRYPTDGSFRYVAGLQNKDVQFGPKAKTT